MGIADSLMSMFHAYPPATPKKFNVYLGNFVGDAGNQWQQLLAKRLSALDRVEVHHIPRNFSADSEAARTRPLLTGRAGLSVLQKVGGQLLIFGEVAKEDKPVRASFFMQRISVSREENSEYFIAPLPFLFDASTQERCANVFCCIAALETCTDYNMKGSLLGSAQTAFRKVSSAINSAFYAGGQAEQQAFLGCLYTYTLRRASSLLDMSETPVEELLDTLRNWLDSNVERVSSLGSSRMYCQLGQAYRAHANKMSDLGLMEIVVEMYQKALGTCSREESTTDWVITKNNLGIAFRSMGEWSKQTDYFQKSLNEYLAVLSLTELRDMKLIWATTLSNCANAYLLLGKQTNNVAPLVKAIYSYREAAQLYRKLGQALDLAITLNNTANATEALAMQKRSRNDLQDAIVVYEEALGTFSPGTIYHADVKNNISRCQANLLRF